MELGEVVRRRRMVRRYTDEPVDPAVVRRALEHATRAPSAGFTQGWEFLLLDTPGTVEEFWAATSPRAPAEEEPRPPSRWLSGMRTAPVVIVPLADKEAYLARYAEDDKGWTDRDEARWLSPYWELDTAMASLLVLLTAVDEGLGGCFFGVPVERVAALRAAFGVPDRLHPIGAITLGHPAPVDPVRGSRGRRRRGVDEVVHHGRWGVGPDGRR